MSDGNGQPRSARGKIVLLGGLLFLAGLVIGCLLGFFGMRHVLFRFRPPPESIANRRALQIQRDFNLSEETKALVERENEDFFRRMRAEGDAMHQTLERLKTEHIDRVAAIMPDQTTRERWLKESPSYFPPGPPPPPPPPAGAGPMRRPPPLP